MKAGAKAAGILVADDATGIGVADDILIPIILAGATAKTFYDNWSYLKSRAKDLDDALTRLVSSSGDSYQYRLVSINGGVYDNLEWGMAVAPTKLTLKAGDTYKIGTAQIGYSRYSNIYLNSLGLRLVPEYWGSKAQVEAVEKLKLIQYTIQYGHLPPGNTKYQ